MACRSHHLHPTRPDRPRPGHPLRCQFGLACVVSAGRRREHPTWAGPGQGRGRAACDRDGAVRSRPLPPVPGNQHQRDPADGQPCGHYCHQAEDAATEAMLEAKHFRVPVPVRPRRRRRLTYHRSQSGHLHSTPATYDHFSCLRPVQGCGSYTRRPGGGTEQAVAEPLMGDMQAPRVLWSRQRLLRHRSTDPGHRPKKACAGEPSRRCSAPAVCWTGPPPGSRWPVGPAGPAVGGRLARDGQPPDG